jgi:hypothetical protein
LCHSRRSSFSITVVRLVFFRETNVCLISWYGLFLSANTRCIDRVRGLSSGRARTYNELEAIERIYEELRRLVRISKYKYKTYLYPCAVFCFLLLPIFCKLHWRPSYILCALQMSCTCKYITL